MCVKASRIIVATSSSSSLHDCLIGQSSFSKGWFFGQFSTRHYVATATSAVPKLHTTNPNSFSASPNSCSPDNEGMGVSPSPKSPGHRKKKREEEQVRGEEIRRKALATLDKSTKFIAAGLNQSEAEPTLSDLDALKPTSSPPFGLDFVYPEATTFLRPRAPKDSALSKYDEMLEKLVNTLTSKFNKKQLVALYKAGVERFVPKRQGQPRPMKKLKTTRDFAAEIVRWRWKWPYLKELTDRKTYLTSKTERILHLKTNEFFLLLGRSGSTFQELMDQYNVTLTQVKRTDTGFDLSVIGLCYSLDQLSVVLRIRREQIITELMIPASTTPSDGDFVHGDSLRRISKHTNALVEELSSGEFQTSALDASNINAAKRLVFRTQQQSMHRSPSFAAVGDLNIEEYSLFPLDIYRSDRMPLHWNSSPRLVILDSGPCPNKPTPSFPERHDSLSLPSIFRIRKIMPTIGARSLPRQLTNDPVVAENDDKDIFLFVKSILERPDFLGETRQPRITASFGHVAFTPTKPFRTSLLSPLRPPFSLSRLFEWMRCNISKITFIPDIPPSLVKFGISARITSTRLVYRMITSTAGTSSPVLTFDIKPNLLQNKDHQAASSPTSSASSVSSPMPTASLDISADLRNIFAEEKINVCGDNPLQHSLELLPQEKDPLSPSVRIWKILENVVDVTFPSRPVDIRFSSFESMRVPLSDIPAEMRECIRQHVDISPESESPPPPLTMQYKDDTYTLDLYASIKSSIHYTSRLPIIIEEVTDYESNERFIKCLITHSDTRNDHDWEAFLRCCVSLNNVAAGQ